MQGVLKCLNVCVQLLRNEVCQQHLLSSTTLTLDSYTLVVKVLEKVLEMGPWVRPECTQLDNPAQRLCDELVQSESMRQAVLLIP